MSYILKQTSDLTLPHRHSIVNTKYLLYNLFPVSSAICHNVHQINVLATEDKNLRNKQQVIMLFFCFI